jgi:hypothetical protein
MRKQYILEEQGPNFYRSLTVGESKDPNTIEVCVYTQGEKGTESQRLRISRWDWEELCQKTGRYSSEFDWVPEPEPIPGPEFDYISPPEAS